MEFATKDGKVNGLWTAWHDNGEKKTEFIFRNGEVDGPFNVWYKNGQKKEEGNGENGRLAASNKRDENGNKIPE